MKYLDFSDHLDYYGKALRNPDIDKESNHYRIAISVFFSGKQRYEVQKETYKFYMILLVGDNCPLWVHKTNPNVTVIGKGPHFRTYIE